MVFDPIYLLFIIGPILFSAWASWRVQRAVGYYSQVPNQEGYTGAEAAAIMLRQAGIGDVSIVPASGFLTDHYNPVNKTLALSESNFYGRSIAAVGIATHEAGHALQHASHYAPLGLRSALVPTAGIGSNLGYLVMFLGLILQSAGVIIVGAVLFAMVLLFQIITLPVEYDASNRAKRLIVENGIVSPEEQVGVAAVLDAAALTYVAAAVSTLMTLAYFLFRAFLFQNRDD